MMFLLFVFFYAVSVYDFVYPAHFFKKNIAAYKHADGKKIEGRRVLVDVERGRTVKGWLPRRLGGGLGDSRSTKSSSGFRNGGEDRDEKYV